MRRLEFSRQLEAGFGKEFLDEVKALAATLEEYEVLIQDQQLSNTDVLQYLDVVGFFDDLPKRLTAMNEHVFSYKTKKFEEMVEQRGQNPRRVMRLFTTNQADFIQCIAGRPLLNYFIKDVFNSSFLFIFDVASREVNESSQDDQEQARYPFSLEKFLFKQCIEQLNPRDSRTKEAVSHLFNQFSLFSLARQHALHPEERQLEQLAQDAQEADVYASHLKHLSLEHTNGKPIPLSVEDSVPWIKSGAFFLDRAAADSPTFLLLGGVQLRVRFDTEAKDVNLLFDVSRITGDLCPRGLTVLSGRGAFEQLGQGAFYDHIRRVLLEGLFNAIADGTLKEKSVESNGSAAAAHESVSEPAIAPEPAESIPAEQPNESLGAEVSGLTFESAAVPFAEEPTPVKKEEKARFPKTVSYRRAVATLERLGFVITAGGRHHKISWATERGVITLPFLHDHEGSDRLLALAIPKILRMGGVSTKDFVESY